MLSGGCASTEFCCRNACTTFQGEICSTPVPLMRPPSVPLSITYRDSLYPIGTVQPTYCTPSLFEHQLFSSLLVIAHAAISPSLRSTLFIANHYPCLDLISYSNHASLKNPQSRLYTYFPRPPMSACNALLTRCTTFTECSCLWG